VTRRLKAPPAGTNLGRPPDLVVLVHRRSPLNVVPINAVLTNAVLVEQPHRHPRDSNNRSNERLCDVYHRAPTESRKVGVSFEHAFGGGRDRGYRRADHNGHRVAPRQREKAAGSDHGGGTTNGTGRARHRGR
jgi:hypothetical protein